MENENLIIEKHGIIFDRNAMLECFGEDDTLYQCIGNTWGDFGEGPAGTQLEILSGMFEILVQWFLEDVWDEVKIKDFYDFVEEGFNENFTEWEELQDD